MSEHGRTTILPGNVTDDARGRNGFFRPAFIKVSPHRGPWEESDTSVEITASSKRIADMPPIILRLDATDARLLIKALQSAVNELDRQWADRTYAQIQATDAEIERLKAEIAAVKAGEASEHESPATG
jgi:hypothetical protein